MKLSDKEKAIEQVRIEIVNLKKSPLYKDRIKTQSVPVIGAGSLNAKVMFVGEAPGKNEAKTGVPFCGASGRILDALLAGVGLERKKVYITSVVNDRPPLNRDPTEKEIAIYGPFLERQINIIQPKVIATLGRFSMVYLMEKWGLGEEIKSISEAHGTIWKAKTEYGTVTIVPLYHPAAAIYNQKLKDTLIKDFNTLKNYA